MTPEVKQLLNSLNITATQALENLVFPNSHQEDWKYIDLSPIAQIPWQSAQNEPEVNEVTIPEADFNLVFHNGRFIPSRSIGCQTELLVLGSVGDGSSFLPLLTPHLGKHTDDWDYLSQMNGKFCQDFCFIHVPPHYDHRPILGLHYHYWGHHCASHPRSLVVLAPHSQLTIVEVHHGNADSYWSNPLTEIYLGEESRLTHVVWQHQGLSAFHTKTTRVTQAKSSSYHLQTIDSGAHLSRHNLHIQHQGESTTTNLQGLVTIGSQQTSDTHSTIVHSHLAGRSNQLHKCVLRDNSHGVFNGKICVTKQGQLTDASQMSRNLLLSAHARMDTKPQLEIVADNVKCAHGATVSQLDREEQFYLQSRGIDLESATKLLTYAFAGEIIQSIPIPSVRESIAGVIFSHP